ncbi:Lrp/AsnC family transcriptional regulator [Geoglobus acetivorans]|uniref:siroheme decarboxylase n=1 Tax=Geoglobus acetivorans TaxID=565033 RepID=A0A0A7GE42_GEOAI|nr:Heme biosynthesis protein related to NirL and NirH [Geoglobus acetivorans]
MDRELLMKAQYEMPVSETPFADMADSLGKPADYVVETLKEYLKNGIVKKIGPQLNYKAFRGISHAALVGAEVKDVEKAVRIINAEKKVKHNFLREHETYNIWFTIKAPTKEELFEKARELMERCGVENYVVLPSVRVYKMDVKYDLFRGVSFSTRVEERADVPGVEELGIDGEMLRDMERNFSVEERPFRKFAERYGYSEAELADLISELIEKRVVRDFYAVLNGYNAGFRENGMNLIKTGEPEKVAKKLLKDIPEITHLVQREVPEKWNYPVYFMIHAVNREIIEQIADRARRVEGVEKLEILYSLKSFKD